MNRFLIRRILGIGLVFALVYLILNLLWFCQMPADRVSYQELPVQEQIVEESRFRIQPFYLVPRGPYLIWVSIESFEHSEFVEMDVKGSVLLSDDLGNDYLPSAWDVGEKETYKVVGKLKFKEVLPSANVLHLSLFVGVEEVRFSWDIPDAE